LRPDVTGLDSLCAGLPEMWEENSDHARFCRGCPAPRSSPKLARHATPEKTVTVLFSDVSDSTTLGERLDSESVRRVMERYFDTVRHALLESSDDLGAGGLQVRGEPEDRLEGRDPLPPRSN
jgi:hypothetical protein